MAGNTKYKNGWQKEHVDRINLTVPKGRKEKIQDHAQAHGESVNGFINRAIGEAMAHDHERGLRGQLVTKIARESGESVEYVEHIAEILEALKILGNH